MTPTYVSPLQYQSFTCSQLAAEAQRVSAAASAASGAQDSQATKDAVATTAAVIIFWPATFMVQGDKQTAAQLAQYKGQMEAIQQESIATNCGIQFQTAPPPKAASVGGLFPSHFRQPMYQDNMAFLEPPGGGR